MSLVDEATDATGRQQIGDGDRHGRQWPAVAMVLAMLALPMLELLAANRNEAIDTSWLAAAWVVLAVVATAALFGIRRWRGVTAMWRVALVLSILTWLFFNASVVQDLFRETGIELPGRSTTWMLGALLVASAAWFVSRSRPVRSFAAVLIPALVVVPAAQVLTASRDSVQMSALGDQEVGAPVPGAATGSTPDIYYLLLDGYGRPDVLAEYGIDSAADLVDDLEERALVVSPDSFANYPITFVSVASALEMAYVARSGDHVADRAPFYASLGGHNETVRQLQARGYDYVHASTPLWEGSECTDAADVCIRRDGGFSETQRALLTRTPLARMVVDQVRSESVANYTDPAFLVERAVASAGDLPTFLFAHVFAPHPPYLRRADCSLRPEGEVGLETWERDPYAEAVVCLNQQLVEAVDRMLEVSDDPVIIIQSDHGPAFGVDFEEVIGVEKRLANLSAVRLPSDCRAEVPPDLTPVNTFRLVFACLDGDSQPELLPNEYFWLDYEGYVVTRVDPGGN